MDVRTRSGQKGNRQVATPLSRERDMAPELLELATRSAHLHLAKELVLLSSPVIGVLLIPSISLDYDAAVVPCGCGPGYGE
jgi:hypothetical protein